MNLISIFYVGQVYVDFLCCSTKNTDEYVIAFDLYLLVYRLKKRNIRVNVPIPPFKKSVFLVFLVGIFPHLDWIQRFAEYIFVFSPNAGECGPEKPGIFHAAYIPTFKTHTWIYRPNTITYSHVSYTAMCCNSVSCCLWFTLLINVRSLNIRKYQALRLSYE